MREYVKHGIMIVIGDFVNITVLILIVIVFVTGTFCTLDIAIRKFEATEKVGNFKVCKNVSQFLIDHLTRLTSRPQWTAFEHRELFLFRCQTNMSFVTSHF